MVDMVASPAKRRLRVVRVAYSRAIPVSRENLFSMGVVGSSTSFWALGISVLSCTMGVWERSSATVNRAVRFVMLAELASTDSGREELEGDKDAAWARVVSPARLADAEEATAGVPEEKRLTRGVVLAEASAGASLEMAMSQAEARLESSLRKSGTWTMSSADSSGSAGA